MIQAQATSANQNCCNEPPNIKSPLDGDSMLFHGEEVLNNVRENVLFLINQEIEKWDIEMYTLIHMLGQLSNNLPALAKNHNYLCGLRNVDNKILTTQVAAATYLNNQNELNISSNVGDGIRCQIFDDSDCSDSTTVEAESLGTKSGLIGTVLGHAVAWSSWGKSGCEGKCCFQINGGLHHSSRETPLDTESLQIPILCYVKKSKSPSSTRTQVAAVAYLDKQNEFKVHSMKHHRTIHKRYLNAAQKKTKQDENTKDVTVWKGASSKRLTSEYITNNIVICDGGQFMSTVKDDLYTDKNIHILHISSLDLWVSDTKNISLGLHLILPGQSSPVFIHLPRSKSFGIMSNSKKICAAMRSCAQTQPTSHSRDTQNQVFTDHDNKYYSIDAQPGRAEKGVQSGLYKMKHGFPNHHWDCIHKLLKRSEYAFNMFMDTEVIRHIVQVRQRVKVQMMKPSPSGLHAKSARYYNAVGFGIIDFLRCHIDKDFTMSIVQVHLDEIMYQNDDSIVCFFAFPRIGIVVLLQPGDTLMFNSQEPHCISSRCNKDDNIYCISSYLKTQVVGLNDNSDKVI